MFSVATPLTSSRPRPPTPSDTLNIACIGVGGRGREDVKGVATENIYALCDVDDETAAETYAKYPRAKRYKDFRELLEREAKRIDAVVIATPDHTHAAAAIMAMKAGKHVYCEKPLARTIDEVRAMVETAKKSKVVTQMGNQGHANEGTRQIREWVEAGRSEERRVGKEGRTGWRERAE